MSTEVPPSPMTSTERESPWASGLTVFAATIMMIAGIWHALTGIAALVHDKVYITTGVHRLVDLTGWGRIHLLLGILVAGAGFAVSRARPGLVWSGSSWRA